MKTQLLALAIFAQAATSFAQEIDYETGEYEYAQPEPELDDDVVTETVVIEQQERGAVRVMPNRQGQVGPTPTDTASPQPTFPVIYAYPSAGGSLPVIHGTDRIVSSQQNAPNYLPAGAQLVSFDRNAWLAECRARLDTYEVGERQGVIAALSGGRIAANSIEGRETAAVDSYGQCQAYLENYMASARASAGQTSYTQGGQYILVPVTVLVPQSAVYSDGTPVD